MRRCAELARAAMLASLGACAGHLPQDAALTAEDALRLLDGGGALLVDVRTQAERRAGHPGRGAVTVQFGPDLWDGNVSAEQGTAFVESIRLAVGPGQRVLLLCQQGVRSQAAETMLRGARIDARSIADGYLGNAVGPGWRAWQEFLRR